MNMTHAYENRGSESEGSSKTLLQQCREWCAGKGAAAKIPRDMLIITILVLASCTSFGLGYLAGRDEVGEGSVATLETSPPAAPASGQVVASKNGTKYYLPSCAGASRISEANKVWFASIGAAVEAGYSPAANCAGL